MSLTYLMGMNWSEKSATFRVHAGSYAMCTFVDTFASRLRRIWISLFGPHLKRDAHKKTG